MTVMMVPKIHLSTQMIQMIQTSRQMANLKIHLWSPRAASSQEESLLAWPKGAFHQSYVEVLGKNTALGRKLSLAQRNEDRQCQFAEVVEMVEATEAISTIRMLLSRLEGHLIKWLDIVCLHMIHIYDKEYPYLKKFDFLFY